MPRGARQVTSRSRQQRLIRHPELRPRDLSAQDLELVAQHRQLDIVHAKATTATNKRTQQSPNGEVDEGAPLTVPDAP
jgi:hypothetical protein